MKNKITVLVAEDEALILNNIADMIIHNHPELEIAATVSNGLDAIEQIVKFKPDILITDIRMPGVTGLDILKYIHEHNLPTQSIIISSYDFFNYAQEALRLGAKDYLLKPVHQSHLDHSLNKISSMLNRNGSKSEEFNLDLLLSGASRFLPKDYSCFFLLMLYYGNFIFVQNTDGFDLPNLDRDYLASRAVDLLNKEEQLWISGDDKKCYRYILLGCGDESHIRHVSEELFNRLNHDKNLIRPVSIIACRVDASAIPGNLAEYLYQQMRHKCVFTKSIYYEIGTNTSGFSIQELYNLCSVYGEKLIKALQHKDIPNLKITLKEIIQYLRFEECPTETIFSIIKYQYLHVSKELSAMLRVDWEDNFEKAFSISTDWEELYAAFLEIFTGLLSDQEIMFRAEDMMKLIDRYICTSYTEHITNQTLSKRFGFVPSYISKLFKEYKGLSPSEYLTHVRVSKAVDLIGNSVDVNVYDIAKAVGFSDPSYFSRLFKQQTGMQPTEFKTNAMSNAKTKNPPQ
jgi:YesN/AraC family two-component response regulator